MNLRVSLFHIVRQVLTSDPTLGPVYILRVYLDSTYTVLWVQVEDTPSTAFILTQNKLADKQQVDFNLLLPMGFVDSTPYYFMATETVTDLAKDSIPYRHTPPHPLEETITTRVNK